MAGGRSADCWSTVVGWLDFLTDSKFSLDISDWVSFYYWQSKVRLVSKHLLIIILELHNILTITLLIASWLQSMILSATVALIWQFKYGRTLWISCHVSIFFKELVCKVSSIAGLFYCHFLEAKCKMLRVQSLGLKKHVSFKLTDFSAVSNPKSQQKSKYLLKKIPKHLSLYRFPKY